MATLRVSLVDCVKHKSHHNRGSYLLLLFLCYVFVYKIYMINRLVIMFSEVLFSEVNGYWVGQ